MYHARLMAKKRETQKLILLSIKLSQYISVILIIFNKFHEFPQIKVCVSLMS